MMPAENEIKPKYALIMLVDDSAIDNFINQKIILKYNFAKEVIAYSRTIKALDYLKSIDNETGSIEKIPALIFLDLNMPVINGFEFLDEFDKLTDRIKNNCKIAILSSSVNPVDMAITVKNKHVLAFLNKPLLKNNLEQIERNYAYRLAV